MLISAVLFKKANKLTKRLNMTLNAFGVKWGNDSIIKTAKPIQKASRKK